MTRENLTTFSLGGVHPPGCKSIASGAAIESMPLPGELCVSSSQHMGAPASFLVKPKQEVLEGELIAVVERGLGAPIHSPATGKVKKIEDILHPTLGMIPAAFINPASEVLPRIYRHMDWAALSREELLDKIKEAGVVGMGGAGFPTHIKLSPPPGCKVDTLVINGVECESYVTSDHRLMLEHAEDIIEGVRIIMHILKVDLAVIGVEINKPDALDALEKAAKTRAKEANIRLVPLKVKYPQGSEKQLIQAVTNRLVPPGGLPAHVGVVVQNVGTAQCVYQAVSMGKPSYERVVSISGLGIARPANLFCKIGTRISDIVDFLGGISQNTVKCILGGPMMGYALSDISYPICKNNTGVLFLTDQETADPSFTNCIRCGHCLRACPMGLMPSNISVHVERGRLTGLEKFGLMDCFECGSCAYVCPAKRPLVHFIRVGKLHHNKQSAKK